MTGTPSLSLYFVSLICYNTDSASTRMLQAYQGRCDCLTCHVISLSLFILCCLYTLILLMKGCFYFGYYLMFYQSYGLLLGCNIQKCQFKVAGKEMSD